MNEEEKIQALIKKHFNPILGMYGIQLENAIREAVAIRPKRMEELDIPDEQQMRRELSNATEYTIGVNGWAMDGLIVYFNSLFTSHKIEKLPSRKATAREENARYRRTHKR